MHNQHKNSHGDEAGGYGGDQVVAYLIPAHPVSHAFEMVAGLPIERVRDLADASVEACAERFDPLVLLGLQPEQLTVRLLLLVLQFPELRLVPVGRLLHALLKRLVATFDDLL